MATEPDAEGLAIPVQDPGVPVDGRIIIARARRIATCEREVFAAIAPILERHRCRLGTVQEIIDGQAGPVRIVVFASDRA